jgi:type IV pilus assembly protein PilB
MSPRQIDIVKRQLQSPNGIILVTGPTGSGKSTTMYATLADLNQPSRNIITVEDPIEYRLGGVKQMQVNRKAGLGFPNALRSILRADPDVVMIGEMRDAETAKIACEAALTGHLVITSLHTNDAASTPVRLLDMGIEPFMVTSSLNCIVAQRLARRLCERCKEPHNPAADEALEGVLPDWAYEKKGNSFYRAIGCNACSNTGYRGRIAVHEVLEVTDEIDHLIVGNAIARDIQELAIDQGMVPMREDGLHKAASGETSIEEILRAVG